MKKGKAKKKGDDFDDGWGLHSNWGYEDGKKGGFDGNWGWDDKNSAAGVEMEEGREDMQVDKEEGRPSESHSLGTMLRRLGIDPETLGWDEEEGDFVGEP